MRIFVDELPKSCYKCPYAFDGTDCLLLNMLKGNVHYYILYDFEKRHEECPLQPIADHDKQVRKEVCEEIRQNAISHNNLEVDMYYITPQQLYEIEQGETK